MDSSFLWRFPVGYLPSDSGWRRDRFTVGRSASTFTHVVFGFNAAVHIEVVAAQAMAVSRNFLANLGAGAQLDSQDFALLLYRAPSVC